MKSVFHALASGSRNLLRNWRALIVLFVLYLALLGAIYFFFVTREATVVQLLLSLLLALAVPVLFLIIQTMAARRAGGDERTWPLFERSLRDFWKLLVIALPLILVAALAVYLFGKAGTNAPATTIREAVRTIPAPSRPVAPKSQPVHWQTVAITTIEYLLFFLVLPLSAIHLWIATARDGLKHTLRRSARILARAFAPQAVLTYAIGFLFFAIVPYFLIVTRTPAANAWLDVGLLGARLTLAIVFSLVGWVVTVAATGELSKESSSSRVAEPSEGTGRVPAEA